MLESPCATLAFLPLMKGLNRMLFNRFHINGRLFLLIVRAKAFNQDFRFDRNRGSLLEPESSIFHLTIRSRNIYHAIIETVIYETDLCRHTILNTAY